MITQEFDTQRIHDELCAFDSWLCELLAVNAIESSIWEQGPLGAAYKWQGHSRQERFLLLLKITPENLKILNLWIPLSKRKQGLGTAILDYLFSLCVRNNLKSIVIEPRSGSETFWEKLAFSPTACDAYIWYRSITSVRQRD